VDALDAQDEHLKDFKYEKIAQKKGHAGHHADKLSDREVLSFACELKWSGQLIFRAVAELTGLRILKQATLAIKSLGVGASATIVLRPK